MEGEKIYLDHVASTPVHPNVVESMIPYLSQSFGNASSIHSRGEEAETAINEAREKVASLIGAPPSTVIFTSCGTESNNTALKGVALANRNKGNHIIMAHCGLPYFFARSKLFEHDDFGEVKRYLERSKRGEFGKGKVYADVSACATPFRKAYFEDIRKLPEEQLLFGSDFPTPVFELSADLKEAWRDFKAMLAGDPKRIVIPQDNPVDVAHREMDHYFKGHPMFENFDRYFMGG